jgi:hypothetical protein
MFGASDGTRDITAENAEKLMSRPKQIDWFALASSWQVR